MGTVPSKTTEPVDPVDPVDPVIYYVRVGNEDVVTIDRLPTDTLAEARDEIAEEVGGFRYLRNGIPHKINVNIVNVVYRMLLWECDGIR